MRELLTFLFYLLILTKGETPPNCTCVPFYQCSDDENGVIISDGRGLLEVRQLTKNIPCKGYFDVCCNFNEPPVTTPPPPERHLCGTTSMEDFPWSAALLYKEYKQFAPSYQCGVSFIHPKVVITAAHCLPQKGFYMIRFKGEIRPVAHAIIHPTYKKTSLRNDIALLILNRAFKNWEQIALVCIPSKDYTLKEGNCTAATYTNSVNASSSSELLRTVTLPIVNKEECLQKLRKTRLGEHFQLHSSFICAGGSMEDTCGGDGGSPLICPIGERHQQVGIVSWGIGCGGNAPGVYANLGKFRDWIDEEMIKQGLDIRMYRLE